MMEGKVVNEYSLTFIIDYTSPIEVSKFTKALSGLSEEYKRFVETNYDGQHPSGAKLHIEKISEGSIITQLVEYTIPVLPFFGDVNTILDFGKNLKSVYDFYICKVDEKPELSINQLDRLKDIIAPATEGNNKTSLQINGNVENVIVMNFNSNEANAVTNRIEIEKKNLKEKENNTYYKQLFYWDKASRDSHSKSGNFGKIDSISSNSLKVIFEDADIQKSIIEGATNPFINAYIVDVQVQTINDIPKIYKVLALHEILPLG